MNLALVGAYTLIAGMGAGQDPATDLAKFGLKPNSVFTTTNGIAVIAEGETIELVGASDLALPLSGVWDATGRLLDQRRIDRFFQILDDRAATGDGGRVIDSRSSERYVREEFGSDPDERTFAMAFQLSANLTKAVDVRADRNKTFAPRLAQTRPVIGEGEQAYIGEMRVIKPVLPKDYTGDTFDYRLEVPGGKWVTLAEFPFAAETKVADGAIDIKVRWMPYSQFLEVDGRQTMVDYKGYFFTVTLPPVLRDVDLEIVTSDPPDDAKMLPGLRPEHIVGEDQGKAFAGKDLFVAYGLSSRSETRRFILRARPKRIVEFKGIPFRRR